MSIDGMSSPFQVSYGAWQDNATDLDKFYQANDQDRLAIAMLLVQNGSMNLRSWPSDKAYPLHVALEAADYTTARFLLENGANPLIANEQGKTAFFMSSFLSPDRAILWFEEMEQRCQGSPQEIWSMRDSAEQTPLFSIVSLLNEPLLAFLKARQVDFTVVDKNQQSAIYYAYNLEAAKILAIRCILNKEDLLGRTPLAHFIYKGVHVRDPIYYDIAGMLLDLGVCSDRSFLQAVFDGGSLVPRQFVFHLLEHGTFSEEHITKLGLAIHCQRAAPVRNLLRAGENPNWTYPGASFSLLEIMAMKNRDILSFYYLLEAGALPAQKMAAPPLYRGVADVYRTKYATADERRRAVRAYLTDRTRVGELLYLSNQEEYPILCQELAIPEVERVQPIRPTAPSSCTLL